MKRISNLFSVKGRERSETPNLKQGEIIESDIGDLIDDIEQQTLLKKQWLDQQKHLALADISWPDHLFEHFVVVGLPPSSDSDVILRELDNQAAQPSSQTPSYKRPPAVSYPAHLLAQYPTTSLNISADDVCQQCFPQGVVPRVLATSASMTDLTQIVCGKSYLDSDHAAFTFLFQMASNLPLWGVCYYVEDVLTWPPPMVRKNFVDNHFQAHVVDGTRMIASPLCFCLLTHYPFFELHFKILELMIQLQQFQRVTCFADELGALLTPDPRALHMQATRQATALGRGTAPARMHRFVSSKRHGPQPDHGLGSNTSPTRHGTKANKGAASHVDAGPGNVGVLKDSASIGDLECGLQQGETAHGDCSQQRGEGQGSIGGNETSQSWLSGWRKGLWSSSSAKDTKRSQMADKQGVDGGGGQSGARTTGGGVGVGGQNEYGACCSSDEEAPLVGGEVADAGGARDMQYSGWVSAADCDNQGGASGSPKPSSGTTHNARAGRKVNGMKRPISAPYNLHQLRNLVSPKKSLSPLRAHVKATRQQADAQQQQGAAEQQEGARADHGDQVAGEGGEQERSTDMQYARQTRLQPPQLKVSGAKWRCGPPTHIVSETLGVHYSQVSGLGLTSTTGGNVHEASIEQKEMVDVVGRMNLCVDVPSPSPLCGVGAVRGGVASGTSGGGGGVRSPQGGFGVEGGGGGRLGVGGGEPLGGGGLSGQVQYVEQFGEGESVLSESSDTSASSGAGSQAWADQGCVCESPSARGQTNERDGAREGTGATSGAAPQSNDHGQLNIEHTPFKARLHAIRTGVENQETDSYNMEKPLHARGEKSVKVLRSHSLPFHSNPTHPPPAPHASVHATVGAPRIEPTLYAFPATSAFARDQRSLCKSFDGQCARSSCDGALNTSIVRAQSYGFVSTSSDRLTWKVQGVAGSPLKRGLIQYVHHLRHGSPMADGARAGGGEFSRYSGGSRACDAEVAQGARDGEGEGRGAGSGSGGVSVGNDVKKSDVKSEQIGNEEGQHGEGGEGGRSIKRKQSGLYSAMTSVWGSGKSKTQQAQQGGLTERKGSMQEKVASVLPSAMVVMMANNGASGKETESTVNSMLTVFDDDSSVTNSLQTQSGDGTAQDGGKGGGVGAGTSGVEREHKSGSGGGAADGSMSHTPSSTHLVVHADDVAGNETYTSGFYSPGCVGVKNAWADHDITHPLGNLQHTAPFQRSTSHQHDHDHVTPPIKRAMSDPDILGRLVIGSPLPPGWLPNTNNAALHDPHNPDRSHELHVIKHVNLGCMWRLRAARLAWQQESLHPLKLVVHQHQHAHPADDEGEGSDVAGTLELAEGQEGVVTAGNEVQVSRSWSQKRSSGVYMVPNSAYLHSMPRVPRMLPPYSGAHAPAGWRSLRRNVQQRLVARAMMRAAKLRQTNRHRGLEGRMMTRQSGTGANRNGGDQSTKQTWSGESILEQYQATKVPVPGETACVHFGGVLDDVYYDRLHVQTSGVLHHQHVIARAMREAVDNVSVWTVATACRYLSLPTILHLLTSVLLEQQIVMFYPHISILSACVLSVLPMLRPFAWQSLVLPAVPTFMLDMLQAPVPFIIGVQYRTPEVEASCRGLVRLSIAKDRIKNASRFPRMPHHAQLLAHLQPSFDAVVLAAKTAGATARGSRSRPVYRVSDDEARAVSHFLRELRYLLGSMCGDIKQHSISNVAGDEPVTLVLKGSLVGGQEKSGRAFMNKFVNTQMFDVWSDSVLS